MTLHASKCECGESERGWREGGGVLLVTLVSLRGRLPAIKHLAGKEGGEVEGLLLAQLAKEVEAVVNPLAGHEGLELEKVPPQCQREANPGMWQVLRLGLIRHVEPVENPETERKQSAGAEKV